MSITRNVTFNRRKLIGASAGIGAATILGELGGDAVAAPAARRRQDTVKLTFWHLSPEQLGPFQRVMADFTAANPGIEVEVQMTPRDQYKAKLQTALNSGTGPDIFGTPSRPQLDIDVRSGLILDITGKVDVSQMIPVARDAATVDGKLWAVPSGGLHRRHLLPQGPVRTGGRHRRADDLGRDAGGDGADQGGRS